MSNTQHRAAAKQKLLEAIEAGDAGRVKACLARGVDSNGIHLGMRMLAHAIRQPELIRARMVEVLLQSGADPNLSQMVCAAAAVGDAQIVGLLIEAGACPDGRSEEFNPLAVACLHGHAAAVEQLLSAGADVNGRYTLFLNGKDRVTGGTPLMMAAWGGHADIVRRLLVAGADKDAKDSDGRTAMVWTKLDKRSRTEAARAVLESA